MYANIHRSRALIAVYANTIIYAKTHRSCTLLIMYANTAGGGEGDGEGVGHHAYTLIYTDHVH
jgi:hypothetical protein